MNQVSDRQDVVGNSICGIGDLFELGFICNGQVQQVFDGPMSVDKGL